MDLRQWMSLMAAAHLVERPDLPSIQDLQQMMREYPD